MPILALIVEVTVADGWLVSTITFWTGTGNDVIRFEFDLPRRTLDTSSTTLTLSQASSSLMDDIRCEATGSRVPDWKPYELSGFVSAIVIICEVVSVCLVVDTLADALAANDDDDDDDAQDFWLRCAGDEECTLTPVSV